MTKDMTHGRPWKLIFYFTIPLIIGNVFQQLYSMVDTIIVGRYVNVDALAAVGATGAIFFLVIGFVQGVSSGFAIVTAQRFGAGDEDGVRKSVGTCIILCVLITVIVTSISLVAAKPLLHLMNTPKNIFDDAAKYIMIIFAGIFATMYYNMISSIQRALGDSKSPLIFLIFSSVLNIGLDLLFIIKFRMGVAGAGYATVISQLIAAIACTIYTWKKFPILKLSKYDFEWNTKRMGVHLKIGLPMAFQFSVTAIGVMVLQAAVNQFGAKVIAAFTAANKVENLVMQLPNALGITMATYCGQNLGAGRMDRIRAGMKSALFMGIGMTVFCMGVVLIFGESFANLFVKNPTKEVIYHTNQYLLVTAGFYLFLVLLFVFRNALQGMGETVIPVLGGVLELVARFAVSFTLPAVLGYTGVCLASPVAWIAATIPLIIKYIMIRNRDIKISSSL